MPPSASSVHALVLPAFAEACSWCIQKMGCVQSKSAQSPAAEVLPTSFKVANSTKTGVALGNPGHPSQSGDPIYLDRADTWATETSGPLDNSTGFQIKSEGMLALTGVK